MSRIVAVTAGSFGLCLFSTGGCATNGDPDGAVETAAQELENSVHPKCSTGSALVASSDPCVATVCAAHPTCCEDVWDSSCVGFVPSLCGLSCGTGYTMSPRSDVSRCIAVNAGSVTPGATITHQACTGANQQRFTVVEDTLNPGVYRIVNKKSGLCVTQHDPAGTTATQETCANNASQMFDLIWDNVGYYRFADQHAGLCLTAANGPTRVASVFCQPSNQSQRMRLDF